MKFIRGASATKNHRKQWNGLIAALFPNQDFAEVCKPAFLRTSALVRN